MFMVSNWYQYFISIIYNPSFQEELVYTIQNSVQKWHRYKVNIAILVDWHILTGVLTKIAQANLKQMQMEMDIN